MSLEIKENAKVYKLDQEYIITKVIPQVLQIVLIFYYSFIISRNQNNILNFKEIEFLKIQRSEKCQIIL